MGIGLPRQRYVPSGRFDPVRLLRVLALLPLIAGAVGAIYYAMLTLGWHLFLLAIIATVGFACSFSTWAVRHAHCRNRALAAAIGIVSGLGGYLAYFHIDQIVRWGAPITAVDRLPGYIAFRMATDTWIEGIVLKQVAPAPNIRPVAPPGGPRDFVSWALFVFDVVMLGIVPAAAAVCMANRPYSEKRDQWCSRESLYLEPGDGHRLQQELRRGDVADWAASEPQLVDPRLPHWRVTVWYARSKTADDADTAVFLSVGRHRPVRIELAEAAALVPLVPGLQALAGVTPETATAAAPAEFDPTLTHVWPVEPAYAGSLYTPQQRRFRRWRRTLQLLWLPLAGAVLLFGGNVVLLGWYVVPGTLPPWVVPVYIVALAVPLWFYVQVCVVPIDMWKWHFGDTYAMLLDTLQRRPDPLVPIDDPESIYVELLPRRFWERESISPPEESNEGLLRFDWDRGVALFEGESQRIVVSAASILEGHIEVLPGVPQGLDPPYCVMLHVRTPAGAWDLPFFPLLGVAGSYSAERALTLRSLFQRLCGLDSDDGDEQAAQFSTSLSV